MEPTPKLLRIIWDAEAVAHIPLDSLTIGNRGLGKIKRLWAVQLWQKIKQEEEQYGFHVSPLEATAGHVIIGTTKPRTAKEKHTSSEVHHRADSGSVPAFHLLFLDTPQWLLLSGERLQVYIIGRDGTYKGVSAIYKGFENFVNKVWREAPVDNSNAMINMMNKLKYLKKKRVWNGMRQSPKTRKHVLKQELADLEMIIDKGDARLKKQKSKIKWAIEGDENSKYYHGILNKKRNQLSIRGVLVEGDWVENPNMVKNEFLNHFKNRFDRPKSVRPMLNMEFPHHLNSMQQLDLEAEVSNEEIKKAVWDCGVDKSPGPDGFTFGFYKRFWSLIEKDVLAAVKYFFHYSRIPKGCNSSFIALIPKTPEAKMVKDFRPISLIGSLYKIIAKILANRLVVVLGDIVNEVQSAFVADRQILDGPFILNEVLQWCKLKKKHSFILKIDFEKAYDSVRWDYLDDVLRKFGFGEKWCGWIQECLRSSWGSVLVNGSPTEEFQFFKGLKQGDPLSPFIFILVMESLHISFKRVVDAGMFNGIVLNSVMHLSHMFYADDAVFMGQWSTKNIDTIIYVLKCFHRASGLSINLSKSKLLGVVVSEDRVVQAANRIGCGVLKAPFAYLGSKVGGNMSRIKSWDEIVDKMVDRLSKWKMKTLSIGGRLTLLKAVLGSMPIYHMSIFKVPMKVLQRMESIRSRFFSGVDLNSKKSIWVKWSKVLCSKEKGGLGVSSLYALNRALMCKWVWRFTTQKNLLWTRVIKAIHGEDGKNGSGFKVGYKSIWRSILQEVETLKIKGIHLNNFMQKKLGNGADTYFWEDLWHGDMVLKQRYPRLYALEVKKTVDVASKLSQENLTWSFRRAPRSGVEQDQLTDLTTYVEGVVLGVTPDRWYWTLDGSGEFSVASARKVIDDNRFPEVSTQTRWIKAVPIKVNIHAWKVRMDCLPTRLNISRRGIDIPSILCPVCGSVTESSSHLFFDCLVAKDNFRKICRWWEVDFMEVHTFDEWVSWIVNLRIPIKHKRLLEGVGFGRTLTIKWQLAMLSVSESIDLKKMAGRRPPKLRLEKGASEVYGMIAGYGDDAVIPAVDAADGVSADDIFADGVFVATGNGFDGVSVAAGVGADDVSVTSSDATDAETQFALMGLSPQVQSCPFGCNNMYTELKKDFDNLEVQYKECFIQVQAYKSSLQNLEQQKSWYQNNQLALEEKIRILTADLSNTTNMLKYTETLNEQANIDKMNNQVKLEESNARFDKWKESSKNLVKLINSSMSSRSKFGLGYGDTFGSDEVFDLSAPSIFDSCLQDAKEKPLYDWFVKPVGMHAVPPPITGTFMPPSNKPDIDDTQFTYGSKSNNSSDTNSVSNDFVSCDNSDKSSDSETTDFASCVSSVQTSSSKTNEPLASVSSSDDLKNFHKTDNQGPCNITQSPSFSFKENVKTPRNLCNRNGSNNIKSVEIEIMHCCGNMLEHSPSFVPRPGLVPVIVGNRINLCFCGRPFPAGWYNPTARPMTRPKSYYFQQFSGPGSYNQMDMDGGRWGTAVKTLAGCSAMTKSICLGLPCILMLYFLLDYGRTILIQNKDLGMLIVVCSRSMTGNKEKLADFVKIKGGTVTFGGGDGKITEKAPLELQFQF
ncbi:RNA-directed DNA polymerase, eukaryota [Tanacetum coccineum]